MDDLFLYCQQQGISDTPLSKHILAACTLFRFLLTGRTGADPKGAADELFDAEELSAPCLAL